jgi:PAS domain S-box-containing protein
VHEGEELVRQIFDAVPGGAVHVALDGSVKHANAEALRLLGYRYDEVTEAYLVEEELQILDDDGTLGAGVSSLAAGVLAAGRAAGPREARLRSPDGREVWVELRAVPLLDAAGEIAGAILTFLDLTERKAVEARLRHSEARWRALGENLPDYAVVVDRRGVILEINRLQPGITRAEVLGTSAFEHIEPSFLPDYRGCFDRVLETRQSARLEMRAQGPAGTTVWCENLFVPLVEDGRLERVLIVTRDTTQQRRAEEELRRSEESWRVLVKSLPDLICVVDREGRMLQVNRLFPLLSEEDVLGRSVLEFVDDAHREEYRRTLHRVVESAEPARLDSQAPDAQGETALYEVELVPLFTQGRHVERVLIVARDVTARARAEEELRRSEEKWRLLAAHVPDYVSLVDRDARFLSINHVMPEMTEEQIVGTTMYDWIPPEIVPEYRARFEGAIAKRAPVRFESRGYGQGGTVTWWDTIVVPLVEDEAVKRLLVVARDMTERKQTEMAIQESEQRWRALVDSLPDHVMVVDRELRIVSTNDKNAAYRPAAVVASRVDAFIDDTMVEEWRSSFTSVLESGSSRRLETRALSAPGVFSWFEQILVPLAGPEGVVQRVMIVARDISERRAALASVAESERLASVGMVAASVAHEVMNPLTYVLANLDFVLGARTVEESRKIRALSDARDGAKRMQQIVRDLRALGRAGAEERFFVDARSVLDMAVRLAGPEVSRSARLVLDLEDVPGVIASESRLCQVFINLLMNAAQAMAHQPSDQREIRVSTGHDEASGLVWIAIRDRGTGIPADRLDRIFEPFYTTKSTGTGLGLSISKDIIERMGGRIGVESTPGVGTTFTVWLSTTRTAAVGAAE